MPPAEKARHGNIIRIAAESGNIFLHPIQRNYLVEQAFIAGSRYLTAGEFSFQFFYKPERLHSVVYADEDDIAALDLKPQFPRKGLLPMPIMKAASVYPKNNRTLASSSPGVQIFI